MELWQIWLLIGIVLLVLEMTVTNLFFLNVALAFVLTSLCAYFELNIYIQLIVLVVSSLVFILLIRPMFLSRQDKTEQTGVEAKYYGQHAKVINPVNENEGRIALYGEEWQARALNGQAFDADTEVKIVRHEGIIMFVDKI